MNKILITEELLYAALFPIILPSTLLLDLLSQKIIRLSLQRLYIIYTLMVCSGGLN